MNKYDCAYFVTLVLHSLTTLLTTHNTQDKNKMNAV